MVIDELATQFSAYAGPINYRRMTHTRAAKKLLPLFREFEHSDSLCIVHSFLLSLLVEVLLFTCAFARTLIREVGRLRVTKSALSV